MSESGAVLKGSAPAVSVAELKLQLESRGYRVQGIRTAGFGALRRQKVNLESFQIFNQEFVALLRAGLTIPDALALCVDQPGDGNFMLVLERIHLAVQEGLLFSEACAQHPDYFDSLYVAALKAGEKTGEMVAVLARYQEYLRRQVGLQRKIKRAMAYPMFLLLVLVLILGALFGFVMPRFVAMYASFGAALPLPTQLLLGMVRHLPLILLGSGLLAAAILMLWRSWSATGHGRLKIDQWKLALPLIGKLEMTLSVARLTRSLATLLGGGTTLVDALQTTQVSMRNHLYAMHLNQVIQKVTEGNALALALQQSGLFPPTVLKMVQVGESSGSLDKMLSEVAQYYEESAEDLLDMVATLIEPLLMLLMGIIVGSVIIVMYLPIFNLANIIR